MSHRQLIDTCIAAAGVDTTFPPWSRGGDRRPCTVYNDNGKLARRFKFRAVTATEKQVKSIRGRIARRIPGQKVEVYMYETVDRYSPCSPSLCVKVYHGA